MVLRECAWKVHEAHVRRARGVGPGNERVTNVSCQYGGKEQQLVAFQLNP